MGSKPQGTILILTATSVLCFLYSVKGSHSLLPSTQSLNGSSKCDYRTYVSEPIQILNTFCGSVYILKARYMHVDLMAPTDMHATHYFSLDMMCFGSLLCSHPYVFVREIAFGDKYIFFFWRLLSSYDTIGSYKVKIIIRYLEHFPPSLVLKYILKGPAAQPGFDVFNRTTNTPEIITFGNSSYGFYKGNGSEILNKSWTEANVFCKKKDGILLAINNQQEYSFIRRMIRRTKLDIAGQLIYLGLTTSDEGYRWSDGTPGILTDWFRNVLVYVSQPFPVNIHLVQPTKDTSCKCAAMFFYLPRNSGPLKWFLVPCHVPYFQPIVICEFQKKTMFNKMHEDVYSDKMHMSLTEISLRYNGYFTKLIRSFVRCRKGWIFMRGSCFKLMSSTDRIDVNFSCFHASALCTLEKGYMSSASVEVLLKLLHILLHRPNYGSLWLSDCSVLTYNKRRSTWILKPRFYNMFFKVINVMCESEPVKINNDCPPDQFQCKDGTCILGTHRCDQRLDCLKGEDEWDCACKNDDFRCEDGRCIPYSKYCNMQQDCFDNSDEKNCTYTKCPKGYRHFKNGPCVKRCTVGDKVIECLEDGNPIIQNGTCRAFRCNSSECLPNEFVKNMRVDCTGQGQEDELLVEYEYERGALKTNSGMIKNMDPYCLNGRGTQTRCRIDHVHCFERDLACIYDVDKYGFMSGCPHGEHLRDCSLFECPQMFKCPESYCIPYHKVCDGKRDCTDGEDEISCPKLSCPGLFRCRAEGVCLDQSLVCDGIVHCKESFDDESTCSLKSCPPGCVCTGWTISCTQVSNETLRDIPYLVRSLRLSNNRHSPLNLVFENYLYLGKLHVRDLGIQTIKSGMFESLHNLLLLDIRDNKIGYLTQDMFYGLKNLQHLDLSGNRIKSLEESMFKELTSLRYLYLENLGIESVADGTFQDLSELKQLSLKNNSISHVSFRTWEGLSSLTVLDLRENLLKVKDSDAFSRLELNEFYSDHFAFCCLVYHINVCRPEADAFSSCNDLMANRVLKITIWVLGVGALVGNVLVIIVRAISKEKQTASVLIINLSISDLLMGAYLLIIAAADTHYRGKYIFYADKWRTSAVCKIAGFLVTLSSEMSVFMLTVITADRLLVFVFPFSVRRLSSKLSLLIILSGWVFFAILSVLPVVNLSYFGTTYIKNGVCLLFNIAEGKTQGWEYSLSVVTVFNLVVLLFVFIAYICIYCSINKSRKQAHRDLSEADIDLVKRFLLIVVTDFICWMPIILVTLLSFGGFPVSPSVTAWTAVFFLPVNSAMNPFLYTFSSLKQMRKLKKKVRYNRRQILMMSNGRRRKP